MSFLSSLSCETGKLKRVSFLLCAHLELFWEGYRVICWLSNTKLLLLNNEKNSGVFFAQILRAHIFVFLNIGN